MTVISIVAEGVTDQTYLEELLFSACVFEDEPEFVFAQPARDATDRSTTFGGWEAVFEYCKENLGSLSETTDFIIIQLDTDCGYHPNFGIKLDHHGQRRADSELRQDTIDVICQIIDPQDLANFGNRLIFAICVDSLETWVALCSYGKDKKLNAEGWLAHKIGKRDFKKTVIFYRKLSKIINSKNVKSAPDDHSLGMFLQDFCQTIPDASLR